jgi:O-antigen/teichoic acid export membrane protein
LYTAQDLAFFDRGKQFPSLIITNINSSIGAVLFPKMAKEQDSIEQIKRTTRMSIRFSSYIMSPIMFGLAAVSEPFIRIVLTEKWVGCVPLMQWFCLVFLFMPIHTANMQALKAIGRSDTFLKLELIKKTIELLSLFAVVWISVDAIVINMAILTTLFTAVNAFPNRKLLNYNYKEQIRDIFPSIIMSLVMLLLILIFNRLVVLTDLMTIFVDFFLGSALYIGMSIVTKNKEYMYITNTLFKRYGK